MAKTQEFDEATLIGIAKQVALKTTPSEEITKIIYGFDEDKKLSVANHNELLKFVYEASQKWQKPKSVNDMIIEILRKIGYGERSGGNRYGLVNTKPVTKEELVSIHAWIMNPERK